ncbi:MAG TPA: hypothetical protein VLQ68_05740, partial [Rhizobiaceae bacterium]|nr:hypothetical protein [Rhizobiaceae bacterium]
TSCSAIVWAFSRLLTVVTTCKSSSFMPILLPVGVFLMESRGLVQTRVTESGPRGGELGLEKMLASPKMVIFTQNSQFHGGNKHGTPL